nr:hypothetical protein [Pedobacter sp. ASV19]
MKEISKNVVLGYQYFIRPKGNDLWQIFIKGTTDAFRYDWNIRTDELSEIGHYIKKK